MRNFGITGVDVLKMDSFGFAAVVAALAIIGVLAADDTGLVAATLAYTVGFPLPNRSFGRCNISEISPKNSLRKVGDY